MDLAEFLASRPRGVPRDLDIEFRKAPGEAFRLVLMPGKDKWMTWLCTNLPRGRFSVALGSPVSYTSYLDRSRPTQLALFSPDEALPASAASRGARTR